jgi:hypothetical protein
MPNTYTELRKTTVGTATGTVTFNLAGISGYTDLVIVFNGSTTSNLNAISFQFNGDTTSNYSVTRLQGDGGSATSGRDTSVTAINSGLVDTGNSTSIFHIMNYANATTFKTVLGRGVALSFGVRQTVGLWRKTPEAITSILLQVVGDTFTVGSTFSLYGIANADQGAAKATGGIITEDSQYWYHTFGASGAFIPKQSLACDYLVVAGGGGGDSGGGGAGGFRTSIGASSLSVTATTYNITVGAGGSGSFGAATNGSNSVFSTITSTGGARANSVDVGNGFAGGSGSGGASRASAETFGGAGNTPSTTPSQGNAGGGNGFRGSPYPNGGGGGAGGVGGTAPSGSVGGAGGIGSNALASWATATGTGVNGYYAGGGGGSAYYTPATGGAGGLGGGGNGASSNGGFSGVVNTGGGGGAGGQNSGGTNLKPGDGGSGIVIVRYAK